MRQTIQEPGMDTRLIKRLRNRARSNERFQKLVADMRKLVVDGLVQPRWLLEAAKLVHVDEVKRLYIITQRTPARAPGPRPQRKGDSECGGKSSSE